MRPHDTKNPMCTAEQIKHNILMTASIMETSVRSSAAVIPLARYYHLVLPSSIARMEQNLVHGRIHCRIHVHRPNSLCIKKDAQFRKQIILLNHYEKVILSTFLVRTRNKAFGEPSIIIN